MSTSTTANDDATTLQRFISAADVRIHQLQDKAVFLQSVLECLERREFEANHPSAFTSKIVERRFERRCAVTEYSLQKVPQEQEQPHAATEREALVFKEQVEDICTITEEETSACSSQYQLSMSSYDEDMEDLTETSYDDSFAGEQEFGEEDDASVAAAAAVEIPTPRPAPLARMPSGRALQRRCSVTKYNLEATLAKSDHCVEQNFYPRTIEDMAKPKLNRFKSFRGAANAGSLDRHLESSTSGRAVERRCSVTKFNLDCGSTHSGVTSLEEIPKDSIRSARAA